METSRKQETGLKGEQKWEQDRIGRLEGAFWNTICVHSNCAQK